MTPKNVAIEPELFARITEEAAPEGTTADQIANEAMKRYLALRRLDRLQRYGQKRAEELGITEDDVPRLIAETSPQRRGGRVTLDWNVYVGGFVFGGKPKRVLEMAIDGEIEVAVSDPIIQEGRRHLLGKFGWSEPRAAEAIESTTECATHVTPAEAIDTVPTDPDDNRARM